MAFIMHNWFLIFSLLLAPIAQVDAALAWVYSQQQEDGGWSDGFDPRKSSPGITADAIIALWAAGEDLNALENDPGFVLEDYASLNQSTLSVALAAKLVLVAVITNRNPQDFDRVNLVDVIQHQLETASTYETCLAVIALYVADIAPPQNALTRIEESANTDGGWGFTLDSPRDTNTTALCIQASAAYGLNMAPALNYLKSVQNRDGGWPFEKPSRFGTESDAFSTALVIMALHAAGETLESWNHPQETLLQFQRADGAFNLTLSGADNQPMLTTLQVIPALQGISLLDLKP
ncbi:MAG: terpene cyclase/mutase family protein [Anaerolineae bacterium]|nr:MAG: terpene cyclase/mutase family protein [Anaerolineae bacterium]